MGGGRVPGVFMKSTNVAPTESLAYFEQTSFAIHSIPLGIQRTKVGDLGLFIWGYLPWASVIRPYAISCTQQQHSFGSLQKKKPDENE